MGGEPWLIGLEAFPADVALVHVRHDELPVRPRDLDDTAAAIGPVPCSRAAVREGTSIARIMEHLQDASMLRQCPQEIALVRSGPQSTREQQALLPKEADCLDGTP